MRLFLIFFFSLLLSGTVMAKENDLCICQTDTYPRVQVGIFKLGCRVWNAAQSCTKKMTVSFTESLDEILAKYPSAKKVKIGYVGHWASADQSTQFLQGTIVPLIQKYDVKIEIDNTACLATDNAYKIVNYLKTLNGEAEKITFRGNQAVSTGIWDKGLSGKNNFWALIKGDSLEVTFPACKEFENRGCMGSVQGGGTGVCQDEEAGSHVFLRCDQGGNEKHYKWTRLIPEFSIDAKSYYALVSEKHNLRGGYQFFTKETDALDFIELVTQDARQLLIYAAGRQYSY